MSAGSLPALPVYPRRRSATLLLWNQVEWKSAATGAISDADPPPPLANQRIDSDARCMSTKTLRASWSFS